MNDGSGNFSRLRLAVITFATLALLLLVARPALAGGVVGNGTPASCTEAALSAALVGGGTITFNCGGAKSILLLNAQTITEDTVIEGGGLITLTGGLTTRLFTVQSPASLTLNAITLDSAYSPGAGGGAIMSSGTLVLDNVTIQFSQSGNTYCGGAIQSNGTAIITNSTFRSNVAGYGGAICAVEGSPSLHISDSAFTSNRAVSLATGTGGAIHVGDNAQLYLTGGSLTGNLAEFGGAISTSTLGSVTLTGRSFPMSVTDNHANNSGGAIWNEGSIDISRVNFFGNNTLTNTIGVGYGGAIASVNTMTLTNSLFRLNQGRFGGAVFVGGSFTEANATISHTSFGQNTASQVGGGLYTNNETTTITVSDSRFNGNAASAGGGIGRFSARLTLSNSSVTQNSATSGGGLSLAAGPQPTAGGYVRLSSVTISSNTASSGQGGGVLNSGMVELYNTTIVDNTNGVFSVGGGNTRFRNSVLHNPGGLLNCDGDGTAQISDDARNFSTDNSCVLPNSQTGPVLDPMLAPLAVDALGITSYHMPLEGSPLINGGFNCPALDQRGALRPDECDIGAVEYGGLMPRAYLPITVR